MNNHVKIKITIFNFTCVLTVVNLLLNFCNCSEKKPKSYYDLRENADYDQINISGTFTHIPIIEGDELNYTKALLTTWKLIKTKRQTVIEDSQFSQTLCFVGDYESLLKISESLLPEFKELNDSAYIKRFVELKIPLLKPRDIFTSEIRKCDIVMFNEAHDRGQTRAFIVPLLADLKESGFKNLAMETLSLNGNLDSLDYSTGFYSREPVMGQLIREALRLGFKLIPYEATPTENSLGKNDIQGNPLNKRERIQAENIFGKIKRGDNIEKTVIIAGYDHIAEISSKDSLPFISMAVNLSQKLGRDPLTFNQTILLEGNINQPYIKRVFDKAHKLKEAMLIEPKGNAKKLGLDSANNYYVYHPNTEFTHHRPNWLLYNPEMAFHSVALPPKLKVVLAQAFLEKEAQNERLLNKIVPFDQTFISEYGKVWFVLKKNEKYKVVFRGQNNEVLHEADIKTGL